MNPPEAQSDSSTEETYFDPEATDPSEQYFSASLEGSSARPEFVVDESEPAVPPVTPESLEIETQASRSALTNEATSETSSQNTFEEPSESDWRDLVSAKVKHYKTLKPRKERYPSLQLQFDAPPVWRFEPPSGADLPTPPSGAQSTAPQATYSIAPPVPFEVTTETTARVLEFPRPGMLPFNRDELADPVSDRPRIMEAPELLPPPALGGILIESLPEPESARQPGLDMPLQTAPLSRRIFAAGVDAAVVSMALAIFGYIFLRFNSGLPLLKTAGVITVVLFGGIWFVYQYAFLTFCGTTPGLGVARLRIACFDGSPATRNIRRLRVFASVLSCVSLGLGYAWCFFDEDELCWHDRITRTHLAPK
jgi:uncharacterized RDD family membrane protein YckC